MSLFQESVIHLSGFSKSLLLELEELSDLASFSAFFATLKVLFFAVGFVCTLKILLFNSKEDADYGRYKSCHINI